MPGLRSATKRLLTKRLDLSVRRRDSIRYGDDWAADLRHYLGASPHHFLDIGANEGQTAELLLAAFPDAEIHSFEPLSRTFETLRRNLAGTGVRAVNTAIGASVGKETIYAGERSGVAGFHASGNGELVEVTTVDAYVTENFDGQIDLLKIDTEGHEMPVLEGASETLGAGRVANILCECDFDPREDEPHGDFAAIQGFLRTRGFRVVASYCEGVDNLGWLWGDVLWHRIGPDEKRRPDSISTSPYG